MKMQGEEIIAAPRQVVWDALNDPEVLKQCITGCDEIKKKSPTEFEAKVTARVGPVKASFVGNVKMSKLNPPRSYVISGEGKGGIAGFAKGGATVQLSDTADGSTKLSYDVDAQVGGKLAQIGSRLIDSTAKKMASDFFKKFNKLVSDRAKEVEIEKKSAPAGKKAAARKPASKSAVSKSPAKTAASSEAAARTADGKATAAKTPATKTPATKTPATKTPAKAAASKTAAASKASAKSAVKSEKTKTAVSKAAASKTASTAAKPAKAAKAAKKAASKSAASKPAAKTASRAPRAASAKPGQGAGSVPAGRAAPSAAPVSNQAAPVTPQAVAASPVQKTSEQVSKPADNIPPQAKAMSSVWLFALLAAVAGLIAVWAMG